VPRAERGRSSGHRAGLVSADSGSRRPSNDETGDCPRFVNPEVTGCAGGSPARPQKGRGRRRSSHRRRADASLACGRALPPDQVRHTPVATNRRSRRASAKLRARPVLKLAPWQPIVGARQLACYGLTVAHASANKVVEGQSIQKGLLRLRVDRAERLCLPSGKSLDPTKVAAPVRGFEHFECYAATPIVRFRSPAPVRLRDQFVPRRGSALTATIGAPHLFCTPVAKNGLSVRSGHGHLPCYRIATDAPFKKRSVSLTNQFGRKQVLNVMARKSLPTLVPARRWLTRLGHK
jgi:hypothetical protein